MRRHGLRRAHGRVPVTALAYASDKVLLAGEGNLLVAHNASTKQRLASATIFRQQAIHGVFADESTGIHFIYGGRHFALVTLDRSGDDFTFTVYDEQDAGDWILDVTFSPLCDTDEGTWYAWVTAHNAIGTCKVSIVDDRKPWIRVDSITEVIPGSNCLLYCAHIQWLSASQCLIASGTAFGDVILWSCTFPQKANKPVESQVHRTLSAHEGSVFGVHISHSLEDGVMKDCTRVLATCSDDRNVKLWDISSIHEETVESIVTQAVETGFGGTTERRQDGPRLLAAALGHISRIWSVHLMVGSHPLKVWTFGEDATRIEWRLELTEGSEEYVLHQTRVESCHAGKNIWSKALMTRFEDTCVTGGADGSIAVLPEEELYGPVRGTVAAASLLPAGKDGSYGLVKSYAFVAPDVLVAVTGNGSIDLITLLPDGTSSAESLGSYEDLSSYSVTSAVEGMAVIGGKRGEVYLYDSMSREVSMIASVGGKVAGVFLAGHSSPGTSRSPSTSALVTTLGSFKAHLMLLHVIGSDEGQTARCLETQQVELPGDFVMTSFTIFDGPYGYAVLGSRSGAIAVCVMQSDQSQPRATNIVRHKAHRDAITALRYVGPGATSHSGHLFASSRDGSYTVHLVTSDANGDLTLDLVHQLDLSFGPNIEGLRITEHGHLHVWGFKSKHFIVHDVTAQEDIMRVECGGVHCSWAFYPADQGGTFASTQAGKTSWTMQTQQPIQRINAGGHGREIKACAVSPGSPQLIATGAEDTDIKLFTYTEGSGFQCLQTLRKHVTGIQHLQWSSDGTWLFSSGGFEEFYGWKVTRDVPYVNVGVVCAAEHPRNGKSDLRIMGFDIQEVHGEALDGEYTFHITMAYSDSTLKTWSFNTRAPDMWTLVARGSYLTSCLSGVHVLGSAAPEATILTTSTDGHLALWSPVPIDGTKLTWNTRHKVHQNAILSSIIYPLSDSSTLVVTGGDDNALAFTRVSFLDPGGANVQTLVVPRAHAAAITGVLCRRTAENDVLEVVSVGLDQRVKVWRVGIDVDRGGVDGLEVQRQVKGWSCVADAGDMVWLGEQHGTASTVVGVGVGTEVWALDGEHAPIMRNADIDTAS